MLLLLQLTAEWLDGQRGSEAQKPFLRWLEILLGKCVYFFLSIYTS